MQSRARAVAVGRRPSRQLRAGIVSAARADARAAHAAQARFGQWRAACAADIVIGGPSTRFRPAYPSLGLSPDGGLTWTLQRAVGTARARELILTDRVLTGEEAFELGLLARLVPDDAVQQEAEALATTLTDGPTSSLGQIKRLLWRAPSGRLADQLEAEAEAIAACADSPEGREGVQAFVHKRAPQFADARRSVPSEGEKFRVR